jgi:hypothetical protein
VLAAFVATHREANGVKPICAVLPMGRLMRQGVIGRFTRCGTIAGLSITRVVSHICRILLVARHVKSAQRGTRRRLAWPWRRRSLLGRALYEGRLINWRMS